MRSDRRGPPAPFALPPARAGALDPGVFHTSAEGLPGVGGAYALVVELDEPLVVALPGRAAVTLAAGRYVYCGSARGPGGIRARVGRHLKRGKTVRWHIDRLTEAGRVPGVWVFLGGNECALVAALAGWPVPLPGFGSSDCAACSSHLLGWPPGAEAPWGGWR